MYPINTIEQVWKKYYLLEILYYLYLIDYTDKKIIELPLSLHDMKKLKNEVRLLLLRRTASFH